MKKLVTLVLVLLFSTWVLADVEVRVAFVNFTQNVGGIETLDVKLEARANGYGYPIEKFQGSFDIGANLAAQIALGGSTSFADIFFNSGWYDQTYNVSNSAVNYYFKRKTAMPPFALVDGSWVKIFDLQIQYQYDNTKKTTFTWSETTYGYSVEILGYIQLWEGGPYVSLPISVTGGKIGMPASLIDRSLPVQMNHFVGNFDFNDGISLIWKTQSETDCAGFNVFRSDEETGKFVKVSTSMIQANGNSSSEREYKFVDKNVILGSKYWYKIQEISTFPDETNEIYYGNLSVSTPHPPDQFALKQNYPNPFNPETKIAYELPERANVVLKIYNLLGKEVRTLVNESKEPGIYEIRWDGLNEAGKILPSGLYFYKMIAGDRIEIRKMMKVH